MENNRSSQTSHPKPGYGPAPGAGRVTRRRLSPSRAAVLETLRAQEGPTSVAALVASSGLHANTVREHLEALLRAGLVRRHVGKPSGRGRPAWLYEATGEDAAANPEYARLAATLAAVIDRTSPSPVDDAEAAGLGWGRELARERGARPTGNAREARRAVIGVLDDVGFAPEPDRDDDVVRLTRCPLLEAAHQYPDVVCGVHLGLARGALEEFGADASGTRLLPFAEPGACRLHLGGSR